MSLTTAYRKLTQDEFMAEARERFGSDPLLWAFRCPHCGDIASPADFKAAGAPPGMAGQECIGRSLGALKKPAPTNTRGCDWAAYGLFRGPWEVVVPAEDGKPEASIWAFPLAEPATSDD
ncbi:VVA0879 family protein [Micromonospora endolithica]|uniref:Uncharacterized protein n=1 Tax=Micromonospora endolithica TaxID=230091 RepID=A0A3A9YR72_9ACTN|nr:VVA0879 family protein [Micromonospora endolithica]RKN38470.1 hypothetical protein D7223_31190 [Micromonospora endolithica]TWJ23107.1 hypothetical protein JD76_03236 [Micromonospora endolithica]